MLTAIGRAAAQRLLVLTLPSAAIPRCRPVVRAACRRFSTSRLTRLAANASSTTTKTKKAMATEEESAAKKKKKTSTAKKTAAAKKPKAKRAASEPKSKPKPKPKKELTPEEKLKLSLKEWKKAALLPDPKGLPSTGWGVYVTENTTGGSMPPGEKVSERIVLLAQSFKNLSSDELQRLKEAGYKNKLANIAAYKAWVMSHTPVAIAEANKNRKRIRRVTGKLSPRAIRDERLPKKPPSSFLLFCKMRRETVDFPGEDLISSTRVFTEEWKTMQEAERRPYEEMAQAELERFARENLSVLGRHGRKQRATSE